MISTQDLKAMDQKYIWHPFTQMNLWPSDNPLVITHGEGVYLYDTDGNAYIDGISSLWVNVHGHNHPILNQAIINQTQKIAHSTLLGLANEPSILLAEKLVEITPKGLEKVFYSDNGSTAMEVALKMAYQYWQLIGEKQKKYFVTFEGAYHGDTIGSVSLGGIDLFHQIFGPLLFETIQVKNTDYLRHPQCHSKLECANECLRELENLLATKSPEIIGIVIEPLMQGANGMIDQPRHFLKKIQALAVKYNCLLICDEVATGFGRTGHMFACLQEEVTPDIMAIAKGISGGYLPIAATLTTEKIYHAFLGKHEEFKTFFHGHTYTGNPLACAVSLANIKLMQKDHFFEKLNQKIIEIHHQVDRLNSLEHVGDIRKKGMMIGIELVQKKQPFTPYALEKRIAHQVILKAREKGVILRPLGNVIVLMPPLSINKNEIKLLINATFESISEVTSLFF